MPTDNAAALAPASAGNAPVPPLAMPATAALPEQEVDSHGSNLPEQPVDPEVAIRQVNLRLEQIEKAEDLGEEEKAEVLKTLSQTLEWLEIARQAAHRARQYEAEIRNVPQALDRAQAQLNQPADDPQVQYPPEATLLDLEQSLADAEQRLNESRQNLADKKRDIRERADHKAQLGKRFEEATRRLQEALDQQKTFPSENQSASLTAARRFELQAREIAAQYQLQLCQAESRRHKAVTELLPVERDLAQRAVARDQKITSAWKRLVANYRKFEAERQVEAAAFLVQRADPLLKPIAQRNAQLAARRLELVTQIDGATTELTKIQQTLAKVEQTSKAMQEKVKGAGLSVAIGLLLRKHRKQLPDVAEYARRLQQIEAQMPPLQLSSLELEDERAAMADLDNYAHDFLAGLDVPGGPAAPRPNPAELRDHLRAQRDYLDNVLNDQDTYQEKLGEIDIAGGKLIQEIKHFSNFIDRHVLWIRSAEPLGGNDFQAAGLAIATMCRPAQLRELGFTAWENMRRRSGVTLGVLCCFACLLFIGGRLRKWLLDTGERSHEHEHPPLGPTLEALALTILLSAVWPTLIWLAGWLLATTTSGTDLVHSVARACNATAVLFFAVEIVRQIARRGGLAEQHLGWPIAALSALRNSLRLLLLFGLPLVFAVVIADTYQSGQWADSLGRLAFISGMVVLAWILHRVARRSRVWFRALVGGEGAPARSHFLWHPLLVGTPLALALLAGTGYYYSAGQLAVRMKVTFWVLLALLIAYTLISHGLTVVARKIMQRLANEQLEKAQVAPADSAAAEAADEAAPVVEDESFDFEKVTHQVQRLLRGAAAVAFLVASWYIWAEVLPAIQFLDRVELWSSTAAVAERVMDADGNMTTTNKTVTRPITLNHAILALVIFQLTYVAARNLPALLRITILDRLPIDSGGRHAVAIICGYVVTVTGCLLGLGIVGITWSSLQWLVAAMTVGLGFGLQEIFANFVSGLILLLERPIRLGDFVTVGDTTGHVTRMQIRATTITDLDHRELIVPNKNFITGELINWTLTNPVTRVVIPVGIAYGSDTALAKRELLTVATGNPLVLDEPAPNAVFAGFGDSSLNFELRVFIPSRDVYAQVLHEVNTAIDDAFRAANIEIAFPQQDLHIRSVEAVLPLSQSDKPADDDGGGDTRPRMAA